MLGCVLNWNCLLAPAATATRMYPSSSLFTTNDSVPVTSRFSSPPCLFSCTFSFSSMLSVTGSAEMWDMTVAVGPPDRTTGRSISTASPSFARLSKKSLPAFLALPSCIPLEGPLLAIGLATEGSGRLKLSIMVTLSPGPLIAPEPLLPKPVTLAGNMELALALVSILDFSISLARFFMISLVSLILLCMIILCSFSSWLSISQFCLTCRMVMFSLFPSEITSSKAKMRSKACSQTASSSRDWPQNSGTSLDKTLRVSKSSRILLCLLVISTRNRFSMG
mmetsp:Transcript_8225/g.14104  ORF Transcript_8225/g.14104 Transcript_8225/m.14104 type:complete len:279 (+) Transcript_8225:1213-2049(+)